MRSDDKGRDRVATAEDGLEREDSREETVGTASASFDDRDRARGVEIRHYLRLGRV